MTSKPITHTMVAVWLLRSSTAGTSSRSPSLKFKDEHFYDCEAHSPKEMELFDLLDDAITRVLKANTIEA